MFYLLVEAWLAFNAIFSYFYYLINVIVRNIATKFVVCARFSLVSLETHKFDRTRAKKTDEKLSIWTFH